MTIRIPKCSHNTHYLSYFTKITNIKPSSISKNCLDYKQPKPVPFMIWKQIQTRFKKDLTSHS